MPMRTEVNVPNDSLFQLENFIANVPEGGREINWGGFDRIIVAPTSWLLKSGNLLNLQAVATHPAWMYSGMNYWDDTINIRTDFRHYKAAATTPANAAMPNPKKDSIVTTMVGSALPISSSIAMLNNVPIHYYGTPLDSKKPGQANKPNTFLTRVIDEDLIEVECLSPIEYQITVKADLTEDQWFYLPETNAKGMSKTIWGTPGHDSTLPDGACAGLVKIHAESMLDYRLGQYTVTGDELAAVQSGSIQLYTNTLLRSGTTPPSWYTGLDSSVLNDLPMWKALNWLVENNTKWFACGYRVAVSTVGTGIFVKENNKACIIPYGMSAVGHSYKKNHAQIHDAIIETVPMGTFLECENFLEEVAKAGFNTENLPDGTIIPFAAAELQYVNNVQPPNGSYKTPHESGFNYPYKTWGASPATNCTPTYIPTGDTQHCYVPKLNHGGSTMVSMMQVTDLTADVNLMLLPDPDWIVPYSTAVSGDVKTLIPKKITQNAYLDYVPESNPTNGYTKDQCGFRVWRGQSSSWVSTGRDSGYYVYNYYGTIEWYNPVIGPTVGMDSDANNKTNCPMVSGMVMAFAGFLPAGTPAGTYLWKPFASTESVEGNLSAVNPEFIASDIQAPVETVSMSAPYIGTNIVTAELANLDWNPNTVVDYQRDYTYIQVLKGLAVNPKKSTTLTETFNVTLDLDTVPLIGYPTADKPMLIDIDDWSGDAVCDIEDLTITNPFFDEDLIRIVNGIEEKGVWVAIAASAQMGKMYRIEVDVDETGRYIKKFLRVRDSAPLFDTPYGRFVEILGLCYTRDIHYLDGKEDNHLVIYGRTEYEDSAAVKGSNLVVGTCRTYMEWDVNKDTICRVRIEDTELTDFTIGDDIMWPKSIAVMYPYCYVLGYSYVTTPSNPILPSILESIPDLTGKGWQMCMWKIDITSGIVNEVIPLADASSIRFGFGIPALDKDANSLYKTDYREIGSMMKYSWGSSLKNQLPTSASLPRKSVSWEFPALSGLCGISGQLLAFSNYQERPVLINPVTGCIEVLGLSIYPFTYPFNGNVSVSHDVLAVVSRFGGRPYYTTHPFFHVCIGDGLPPNNFGMGIDIQDVSKGRKLVRLCRLKNNLVRDRIEGIELYVPDPSELPGSELLWLSLDGKEESKAKSITFPRAILPGASEVFYLHAEPDVAISPDELILYLNTKFDRVTVFFGYRMVSA